MDTRQLLNSTSFLPKLNSYQIYYNVGAVGVGVTPAVVSTSSLWIETDITFSANNGSPYPSSFAWNAYFDSAWHSVETAYIGIQRFDPSTGTWTFSTSNAFVTAGNTGSIVGRFSISPDGLVYAASRFVCGSNMMMQGDATNGYIRTTNGSSTLFLGCDNQNKWAINSTFFYPVSDNAFALGAPANRPTVVYAVSGTINTSDETEKHWINAPDSTDLAIAKEIFKEIGTYQWLDAIEAKGDQARTHYGVRAQRVWKIVADAGRCAPLIDNQPDPNWEGPPPPAYLCYDELEEGGGRFGVRTDQLNLLLNWALHERLKLLEG